MLKANRRFKYQRYTKDSLWAAEILERSGAPTVLDDFLEREMPPPFDPCVFRVYHDHEISVISSSIFSGFDDPCDVYDEALRLLSIVSSLMQVDHGYEWFRPGRIFEISDDRKISKSHKVYPESTHSIQGDLFGHPQISLYPLEDFQTAPQRFQRILPYIYSDPVCIEALQYIASDVTWEGLYKAYEALGKSIAAKAAGFKKKEISQFTGSANMLGRHHDGAKIQNPMRLFDAAKFIRRMIFYRLIKGGYRRDKADFLRRRF